MPSELSKDPYTDKQLKTVTAMERTGKGDFCRLRLITTIESRDKRIAELEKIEAAASKLVNEFTRALPDDWGDNSVECQKDYWQKLKDALAAKDEPSP
jgi:hypothetical protein